jgi:hypothetical protein
MPVCWFVPVTLRFVRRGEKYYFFRLTLGLNVRDEKRH